jgi:peptide/nickel transport system ATP-binding protein
MQASSPAANNNANPSKSAPLLQIEGLTTHFFSEEGEVHAVDLVDLTIHRGETLGIVGESGCGKSVTALSVMRLIADPGKIIGGSIRFDGNDLLQLTNEQMRLIRGDRISMIFQQPTTCLNPVFKIGDQIAEVLMIHRQMGKQEAWKQSQTLLEMVGIPDPRQKMRQYSHELSGGQAQRVMIAMALACEPELLIADEPTTALDVTIQAQILDLMKGLREKVQMAMMLITHDMGVVAEMADRVVVMYAGQVVEQAEVALLFTEPKHPYTQGLLASVPVLGQVQERLADIPGVVPDLITPPKGCRFASRCEQQFDRCDDPPPLLQIDGGRKVRCWLYAETGDNPA